MHTPLQKHFLRVTAEQEAATRAATDPMAGATGYELMMAKLAEDRRNLKLIESTERKIEHKRTILADYDAYVDGAIAGGKGAQDDVLMTVMVWALDCADYARALPVAEYGLAYGMTLPDQFARNLPCLVAEEVATTELKKRTAQQPMDVDALHRVIDMTADHDMPDQARAKLHKATGFALRATDPQAALHHLRRALALHDGAGVKKDIEQLEREVKNATGGNTGDAPTGETGNQTGSVDNPDKAPGATS